MTVLLVTIHTLILVTIVFQYIIRKDIVKINTLLNEQLVSDRKMMDNLSKSVISLSKENSKLRSDNSELKKNNEILSEKIKKMNEKLSSFSNMFKNNA